MIIGNRLREIREHKKLSQRELEERTGLLRCYISRVENGHTVPTIETLEKLAGALEIPLYQWFYDADGPPGLPVFGKRSDRADWGRSRKGSLLLRKIQASLGKMKERDRRILLAFAQKASQRNKHRI